MINQKVKDYSSNKLTPFLSAWRQAGNDYCRGFWQFLRVYCRALLGAAPLLVILLLIYLSDWQNLDIFYSFLILVLIISAVLGATYYLIRAKIALLLLFDDNFSSARKSFELSRNYFWNYLGVSILTSLLVLAWSLLLIIPGIIFSVYYAFSIYVLLYENKRPFSAVERSQDLAKHFWWPIFWRLLMISLLGWLIYGLLLLPLRIIAIDGWLLSLYLFVVNFIWLLINPLFIAYLYRLYKDLVKIKDEK